MAADGARWRHGLRARLLAGTVLVAVCSITATAWLAAHNATGSIEDALGRTRADTARIYDDLLAYAATHPSWDGVGGVLADLGRRSGLRIRLTAGNRFPIAGAFGPDESTLPAQPAAVLDALAVDVTLQPGAPADRIDARAIGPFRLTSPEHDELRSSADADASCPRGRGMAAQVVTTPSGRSFVSTAADPEPDCARTVVPGQAGKLAADRIVKPTISEQRAMLFLNELFADCLRDHAVKPYEVALTASGGLVPAAADADRQLFLQCLGSARHTLLASYVTPAEPAPRSARWARPGTAFLATGRP
jgi:two-component system sensor histidine kinase BaeS